MFTVKEYAEEMGITVNEVLKKCAFLGLDAKNSDDVLEEDDVIMLDNAINIDEEVENEEEFDEETEEEFDDYSETKEDIINKTKIKKQEPKKEFNKSQFAHKRKEMYKNKTKLQSNENTDDVFTRKEARGIPVKMMDLLGTYTVAVDEKYSIQELVGDVCGKSHDRFRDELKLAQNNGIKLFILVRNDPELVYSKNGTTVSNSTITSLKDLHKWVNPRLWIFQRGKQKYPKATKGIVLAKCCFTIQEKYGCEFIFCSSKDAGKKIVELLIGK